MVRVCNLINSAMHFRDYQCIIYQILEFAQNMKRSLRHVAGTQWRSKRYMSMNHLSELELNDDPLSAIIVG